MKKIIFILLSLIAFVSLAEAQTHNQDAGAYTQGLQPLGHTTDGTTTLNTSGKWGKFAVSTKGSQFVTTLDPTSGLTQSVIPVSSASSLNGVGSGAIGWSFVVADTAETSSTTTVINATTHSARVGDVIMFTAGTAGNIKAWSPVASVTTNTITISNALPTTPANGDVFYIMRPQPVLAPINDDAIGTFSNGWLTMFVRNELANPYAGSNGDATVPAATRAGALYVEQSTLHNDANPGKLAVADEDTAFAASDAVTKVGLVNNPAASAFNATQGDVTPFAGGGFGNLYVTLMYDAAVAGGNFSPIRLEDQAFAASEALVAVGNQAVSAIAQTVGATGDIAPPSMDLGNRTVVTNAPAGETWYACTGEISTATNTTLKTGVASNRIYVTSFSCAATGTSPNQIYLTDGSGGTAMDLVNTTSNAVATSDQHTYPVPLRGTANTNLVVATITTGTVRCCAAGYISTI